MSNLLLNEYPLVILPSLAVKIGLNEAIFLQQLHYWLQKADHEIDGYKWVYNTYEDWQKQLPFFCLRTVKTIVSSLAKSSLILCKKLGNDKRNRTNWYTINYDLLPNASCKSCTMDSANLTPCSIYTETTTETTSIYNSDDENPTDEKKEANQKQIEQEAGEGETQRYPYDAIQTLYNELCAHENSILPRCRFMTDKRRKLIRERFKDVLPNIADWETFFKEVAASDFLMGKKKDKDGNSFRGVDFDWLLKASNATKIMEWKYSNNRKWE